MPALLALRGTARAETLILGPGMLAQLRCDALERMNLGVRKIVSTTPQQHETRARKGSPRALTPG
jgi:hypothetical protein